MTDKNRPLKIFLTIFFSFFYIMGANSLYSYFTKAQNDDHLIVGVVFILFPAFLHSIFHFSFKSRQRKDLLLKQYKDQLWAWREDWRQRYSSPVGNEKLKLYVQIAFAIVFSAIGGIFFTNEVQSSLRRGDYIVLLILTFPLGGIFSGVGAIIQALKLKKFKGTKIKFHADHLCLGRLNRFDLTMPFPLPVGSKVSFNLICYNVYLQKSGKENQKRRDVLWDKSWQETYQQNSPYTHLSTQVEVPSDAPQTLVYHSYVKDENFIEFFGKKLPSYGQRGIEWILEVESDIEGIDFSFEFELPIFQGDALEDDLSFTKEELLQKDVTHLKNFQFISPIKEDGFDGYTIDSKKAIFACLGIAVFGLLFFVPGWWLIIQSFSSKISIMSVPKIFMGGVFSLLGGGIALLGLSTISFSQKIIFKKDHFEYSRLSLIGQRNKKVSFNAIKSAKIKTGVGVGNKSYYDLTLFEDLDKKNKYCSFWFNIPSKVEVAYLRELILRK